MSRDLSSPIAYVIGEALVDAVSKPGENPIEHPGGSPANVALTLGRLGRPSTLLTWLGRDERGRTVTQWLEDSHVKVDPASFGAERTSVAHALIGQSGGATYEFDLEWNVPTQHPVPGDALVVHTGSIGAVLTPGGPLVRDILAGAKQQATLTYDPNIRPSLMGQPDDVRPLVEGYVALCDVVKVSDEDLEWLCPGDRPLDIAQRWVTLGASLVVVTLGGDGALAVSASRDAITINAPRVDVVDTVGAGDSFMGALIHGLWEHNLLGASQREALRSVSTEQLRAVIDQCVAVAAITVSRAGANPPWRSELSDS